MQVSLGNLDKPRHGLIEPDAAAKVDEMMNKLHTAGFVREENCKLNANRDDGIKSYHIYDLPHKIEFSSHEGAVEAAKIIEPYGKYLSHIMVVG